MSCIRAIPFVLLLVAIATRAEAGTEYRTLCFFSLNNSSEFELTRSFLDQANRSGDNRIHAIEFHNPDDDANPGSSFTKMIESRTSCDGLVISGHHTGSFGGKRASGVLNISHLEQMGCNPKYSGFFKQVKAVWLQGCRTLGIGPIGLEADAAGELQADYHMQRVGAELVQDGLEQSFADLSFEFSATLDQDNPLASRYLRVFPAANVFGWTKSSPGEKAKSEKSLLYHMSHMAHISQGGPLFDPVKADSRNLQADMSQSLWEVLGGGVSNSTLAKDAWLSHGRVKKSGLGFDNPDLNAYFPLLYSSEDSLLAAKNLGCEVRNSLTFHELENAITSILSNQDYVAYNFNVVWEAFNNYSDGHTEEYAALKKHLVASYPLMSLLNKKLKSPQTGLLMKIEYYSFYRDLTGNTNREVEGLILDQVRYFLQATDLAGSQYDIRDFRESLLLSLASHQLAETSFYQSIINAQDVQSVTLYTLTWSFLKESPPEAEFLISQIVRHPKADNGTLRGASLWVMGHGESGDYDILGAILANPKVDEATLGTVSSVLAKYDHQASEQLVKDIIAHPKAGSLALGQASLAIRKHDIAIENSLLEDIVSHPEVDKWGLQNAASIAGKNPHPGNTGLFNKIVRHDEVGPVALSSVAIALSNEDIEGKPQLLQSIRNHPKADARTLRYLDRAVLKAVHPAQEEEFY